VTNEDARSPGLYLPDDGRRGNAVALDARESRGSGRTSTVLRNTAGPVVCFAPPYLSRTGIDTRTRPPEE